MPGSILKVGGPAVSAYISDIQTLPIVCFRSPSISYTESEIWSSDLLDYPVEILNAAAAAGLKVHMLVSGSNSRLMVAGNFVPNVNAAGLTDSSQKLFSAVNGQATCSHEMGHLIDFILRIANGLPPISSASDPTVYALTGQVLVAARAYEQTRSPGVAIGGLIYGATNHMELVAETYAFMTLEIRDPATLNNAVRNDAYIQTVLCNGSASLAAAWRTELRRAPLWPASNTWAAKRLNHAFLQTARYRSGSFQDFYSNEAPTLLFGDEPGGLVTAAPANGTAMSSWGRWDRPISTPASRLTTGAASEIAVTAAASGSPVVGPVLLLGGSSAYFRTTIVFKPTTASTGGTTILLWSARYLDPVTGVDTEYSISWIDSQLLASWITRNSGGTITASQTATSANGAVVAGEVTTVQATFGTGAVVVSLKHRKASAGSPTTVTSASAMGASHAAVPAWSVPFLGSAIPTTKIKAISVEADVGVADQWSQIDAAYSTAPVPTPVISKTGINWLNAVVGDYNMGNAGPTAVVTASSGTLSAVTCSWTSGSAAPTVSGSGTSRTLTFSGNPGASQYIGNIPLPAVDANSDAVDTFAIHGAKFVPNASFPLQAVSIRLGSALTITDTAKIFVRPTSSTAPLTGDTPDGTITLASGATGIQVVTLTSPVSLTSGVSYTVWILGASGGFGAKLAVYASTPLPVGTGNIAVPATGAQYVTANKLSTGTPTKTEQTGTYMQIAVSALVRVSTVLTVNVTIDGTVRTTTITVYGFYEP